MSKFINFTSHTDIGLKRQANEDNYGTQSTVNGEVFIVCDGMGGHVGGSTASKIAVESIASYLNTEYYENIFIALGKAVEFANAQVFGEAQSNPELKGMGTTCTVLIVREHKVYIAHVGDSRIYIQNDGKLKRLTKDHSFVQGLVDKGIIKDSEAEEHPRKNELLQALGVRPEVEVTVAQEAIEPKQGDKFMLCSDGLCGLVNDTDMNQVIQRSPYLETAAKDLIDLAKAAGGNDNITVQLVEVLESPFLESRFIDLSPSEAAPSVINANRTTAIEDRRGRSSQNKKSSRSKTMLIGVVSLLITGLSIGGFYYFMNSGIEGKTKKKEVTTNKGKSPVNPKAGEDENANIEDYSHIETDYSYKVVIEPKKEKCTLINKNDPNDKKSITKGFNLDWNKLSPALGNQIPETNNKALCSEGCFILGANGSYQPLCDYFRNNGNKKTLEGIDQIFITETAWADENQTNCCAAIKTKVVRGKTSGGNTPPSGGSTTPIKSTPATNAGKKESEDVPPAPPTSDPAPPTSDPSPPTSDPAPPTSDPAPPTSDPAPPTSNPTPPTSDPAPPTSDPAPAPSAPDDSNLDKML